MQISISNAIKGEAQGSGGGSSFASTNSFTFDGNNDGVEYGSVYNMADDGSNAFSISCWFKTTSSATQVIVSKQRAISPYNGYGVSLSGGKIRFVIGSNPNWLIVDTINTFNDGNWHNAVVTYDGSRNASGVNIYVDGSAVSTTSVINNAPLSVINTTNFMISGRNGGANFEFGFNGNIDEVGIWTTTELTSTQANEIGGTLPTDLSVYSPTSWWRMGEAATYAGKGWVLTDQVSGGNNGLSDTLPAPPAQPSTDVPS